MAWSTTRANMVNCWLFVQLLTTQNLCGQLPSVGLIQAWPNKEFEANGVIGWHAGMSDQTSI